MSSAETPPEPDYVAQAKVQGKENLAAARTNAEMNNPNIITPYGTQTVSKDTTTKFDKDGYARAKAAYDSGQGQFNAKAYLAANPDVAANEKYGEDAYGHWRDYGQFEHRQGAFDAPTEEQFTSLANPDKYIVKQELSPEQQKLFDQQNRISEEVGNIGESQLGRVKDAFAQPFDMSGIPGLQYGVDSKYNTDGKEVQDALYAKQAQYLDPQFKQQQNDLSVQLANQGILPGSEAYQREMDNMARTKQQAYGDARNSAIIGGGQEQSRLFGMGLQSAELNNSTVNQGIQQKSFLRNLPLNELNSLRSGSQATMPSFQGFTGSSVAPSQTAAAYGQQQQYAQNQANAHNASNASTTGALASTAAAGIGAYASYAGLAAMF